MPHEANVVGGPYCGCTIVDDYPPVLDIRHGSQLHTYVWDELTLRWRHSSSRHASVLDRLYHQQGQKHNE